MVWYPGIRYCIWYVTQYGTWFGTSYEGLVWHIEWHMGWYTWYDARRGCYPRREPRRAIPNTNTVVASTIGERGHMLPSHERKWHYRTYPKEGRKGAKGTAMHTSTPQRNGQTPVVLKTQQAVAIVPPKKNIIGESKQRIIGGRAVAGTNRSTR